MTIALDQIQPEFEQVVSQLQNQLADSPSAWNAILTAGVGQFIVDATSAGIVFNQQSIKRALFETSFDTLIMPSSAIALLRSLGVHVSRKQPAQARVTLQNDVAGLFTSISIFTQLFSINGLPCYNRRPVVFNSVSETAQNVDLFRGTIVQETFIAYGEPFQRFVIGNPDFTVSNEDIYAVIDGNTAQPFLRKVEAPWEFSENERVFYENTLPDGRVEIIFGNSVNGYQPRRGQEITFIYAVTDGQAGNATGFNFAVTTNAHPNIRGVTQTVFEGGSDEKDITTYKILGSALYSGKRGAVNRVQHRAKAIEFGGVIDARLLGQAELFPDDPRYMNIVQYSLLTNSPWSDVQYRRFEEYMRGNEFVGKPGVSMWSLIFRRRDPTPVSMNVKAELYCRPNSNLNKIKGDAENTIRKFFKPTVGSLGYSVYESDLHEKLNQPGDDVVFAKLIDFHDRLLTPTQYPVLGTLEVYVFYTNRQER